MHHAPIRFVVATLVALTLVVGFSSRAAAHCDTLDGPVVAAARLALQKGDVTPVLKWIKKDAEPEVIEAFKQALAVRKQGGAAKELADRYFFETLVRVHRAGEGAPYTGLKPAKSGVDPLVVHADEALEQGKIDVLSAKLTETIAAGLKERYQRAAAAKEHADHNVEAGREYVEAYVAYVHYVEQLANLTAHAPHGETTAAHKHPR